MAECCRNRKHWPCLPSAGIPTVSSHLINERSTLERIAGQLDYPVVLKTAAPGILHKTEVGGVVLNIAGVDALLAAYDDAQPASGYKPS